MLRSLFFITIILAWFSAQAQSAFSVDTPFVSVTYPANEPVFYPWIILSNQTQAPLEMRCIKVADQKPANWETWLENPDSAYAYVPDTAAFTLPTDTQQPHHLIVSFHPNGILGRATVVLKIYPANDPSDSVLLTFQGNAYRVDTTGVDETGLWTDGLRLYPQPVQDRLLVSGNGLYEVKEIRVTDVWGRTFDVPWTWASSNGIDIQTLELPKGMYFLMLQNTAGRMVKRFLKE